MRIPSIITAGDGVSWTDVAFTRADGTQISSGGGWSLKYSLRGPTTGLDITGTANGTGWLLAMTAAQSASLNGTPANTVWYWQAVATFGSDRATGGDGTLVVKPNLTNLSAATTFDGRSPAEVTLAAIEAEITARINNGASVEYSIGNRSLKREPLTALMALRSSYRLIVSRERRAQMGANGLGNPSRVGVRFK